MTHVLFGGPEAHATIFYERSTKVCVIVANSIIHLVDAMPVARSLKADKIIVVAPPNAHNTLDELIPTSDLQVYEVRNE